MNLDCFCSIMKKELELRVKYSVTKDIDLNQLLDLSDKACYIMKQLKESTYDRRKARYIHKIILVGLEKGINIEKDTIKFLLKYKDNPAVKSILDSHQKRLNFLETLYEKEKIIMNPILILKECYSENAPIPISFNNPIVWYLDLIIYPDKIYKLENGEELLKKQVFYTFIINCIDVMTSYILFESVTFP